MNAFHTRTAAALALLASLSGETLVGMVDRTHPGIIRISPLLPREEQDLIAATLMALLMQRKLIEP